MFSNYCCLVSAVSESLWPHGLQHARLACPSLSPGVCSNSCPLSQWCHPTISSSVTPFSSWPQTFPASGSFPMSWLFTSGGQSIWNFIFSISPSNEYSWVELLLDWLVWPPCSPRILKSLKHHSLKASVLWHSIFCMVQNSHPYMTNGKIIALSP